MDRTGGARAAALALGVLLATGASAAPGRDAPPLRPVGLVRARVSNPQLVSVALGGLFFREDPQIDCSIFCEMRGFHAQLDAGPGGGSLGLGWANVIGERTRGGHFLRAVYLGFGARAVLLRTWGAARLDPPERTYAGVEGAFTASQISVTLGVYRRMGGGAAEEDWKWFGGLGWGF